MADSAYDSTADTLKHSQRVGELMTQPIRELVDRSVCHDRSKTEPPELDVFNEYTPKLADATYGSEEYKGYLEAMGEALQHHYAHNRHHPEFHDQGIDGMTLVDLLEMLADWRAATERHNDGSLVRSLAIQRDRFGIDDQLYAVLWATARHFGWLDHVPCGAQHTAPDGTHMVCNIPIDRPEGHRGRHADGHHEPYDWPQETRRTYVSRPVVAMVEAVQWTGDNEDEVTALVGAMFYAVDPEDQADDPEATGALLTSAHSSWEGVVPGAWIVRRPTDGFIFQLGADEFARTYEAREG